MEEIIEFLTKNGYTENTENGAEYRTFHKNGVSSIDVNKDEIVFINDTGDWLYVPVNYYALLGALLHHRQIAINYNK